MTTKPVELKPCEHCGKIIPRRTRGTSSILESPHDYNKRRFCNRICAGLHYGQEVTKETSYKSDFPCPICTAKKTRHMDTIRELDGMRIIRVRMCPRLHRFSTIEQVHPDDLHRIPTFDI